MAQRKSTSRRRGSASPIAKLSTVAETASDSPRRAIAQIRVGRPHSRLRTIDETAEILNVSSRTVRRLIASDALPVHRFGRSVRVSDADIAQLMAASRDD
jgi:excisionase family DNA binding protein